MNWNMEPYGLNINQLQMMTAWLLPLFIWSLVWKGLVLWVTARRGQSLWFLLFLILNTAGIAEIVYLLITKGFNELQGNNNGKS